MGFDFGMGIGYCGGGWFWLWGEGWFYLCGWREERDNKEEREIAMGEERNDEEDKESETNKKFNSIGFNVI